MIYINQKQKKISDQYLNNGYVIHKIENNEKKLLDKIKNFFLLNIKKKLKKKIDRDFLNNIHKYVKVSDLNNFRLQMINSINSSKIFRKNFYLISSNLLENIVGNEIAMQMRISLSIQLPNDDSSLLPVHADTWSGVSPYEVVIWLPMVDCYKTKSMYILPRKKFNKNKNLILKNSLSSGEIFNKIKKDVVWLNVKYGEVLLFDQSLPHGNVVNKEKSTRWSMNCRFKGIFTPYADKKIGEYYEPITLKPASLRGLKFKY